MKNVLVVVSTRSGIDNQTRVCIEALRNLGAQYIEQQGCSDVALARNLALTYAYQHCKKNTEIEVILMVDDDMLFTVNDANLIIQAGRIEPHSGCMVRADGKFFAKPGYGKWLCGLAFLAFPVDMLYDVAKVSRTFKVDDQEVFAFTWSGVDEKEWVAEDHQFCRRLGGIRLLPIRIGHLKKVPLYCAEEHQTKELQEFLDKHLREAKRT